MNKEEKKPENPFAFPVTDSSTFVNDGMTLRDYFAAKAMHAIVSTTTSTHGFGISVEAMAFGAFEIADAMLKQR